MRSVRLCNSAIADGAWLGRLLVAVLRCNNSLGSRDCSDDSLPDRYLQPNSGRDFDRLRVRDDAWTKNPEDGQKTFDMLASNESSKGL
jgi:hypothetical protein